MRCLICQKSTSEHLVLEPRERKFLFFRWVDRDSVSLCREHLIEWFREVFVQATQRMVVFYPNLEQKNGNYQYYFARLKEIVKAYGPDHATNERVVRLVRGWLGMIRGHCSRCSEQGEIAYFGRESVRSL